MTRPTFVVGTGRCGSTLLSRMLACHPGILSLSEVFSFLSDLGGRLAPLFDPEPLDGEAFWRLLAEPTPRSALLLRHGVSLPEVIYPWRDPAARFNADTGIPPILEAALPHLTDRPDLLFDALGAVVRARPPEPLRAHYRFAFDWLRRRQGATLWVERSGAVFNMIEPLAATFPDARYVHLVRDGREAALSMNAHRGFRMLVLGQLLTEALGVDPYLSPERGRLDRLPARLKPFLPECFDPLAFDAYRFPLGLVGRLWSGQVEKGLRVLDGLGSDRLYTLRYEDLIARPVEVLTGLAAFLDVDDPDATARAATLVHPMASRVAALGEADRRNLDTGCRLGLDALAARGIAYPD